jgi:hypothetical protein
MSSERRGARVLLDSMGAFRSALLRVMVAVRRRWLQRVGAEGCFGVGLETQEPRLMEDIGLDGAAVRDGDGFDFAGERKTAKAEESDMKTIELQTILGYLNIGLAIAHNTGVSAGHFGTTDFIQLAQMVNGMFLNAITPVVHAVPVAVVATAPIVINAPAAASVGVVG